MEYPGWQEDAGKYHVDRNQWAKLNGAKFMAASGYSTASGRGKWRVVAETIQGKGMFELCDKAGKRRLFNSFEAANKIARKYNEI